jgi:Ribbon-helix-helix protein, copG family
MTTQLAVRISDEQMAAIDRLVPAVHGTRTELIRRAVELYLYRLECERDAQRYEELPLTPEELSMSSAVNWSSAPAW